MLPELCDRIVPLLARAPRFDPRGYGRLARLKMPGPHYGAMLRALHTTLRPRLYVEIGVDDGGSLHAVSPETRCIAIEPRPAPSVLRDLPGNISLQVATSDDFFKKLNGRERIKNFDLAFIDGDHAFTQALRDFENVEDAAGAGSVIAIHDVIPMDECSSTQSRQSIFWTGDVWRLMGAIVAGRPDLTAFTVACPPSGLGIVTGFNPAHRGIPPECADAHAKMPFVTGWKRQRAMLNIVANDGRAVVAALRQKLA